MPSSTSTAIPRTPPSGLLTVTAFGVLADVETGYPLLLSELTLTTALRTAATSALAARRMARPDSRVMALIGNGAQSEFQAIAFHHMLGIRELRLFDTDAAATDKLERNLARLRLEDLQVVRCGSTAAGGARRRHRDDGDRRQAQRHDPDARHDRARHASERGRRRLPGQDRTAPAHPACAPMRAWSWSSSRSRASKARSSSWTRIFPGHRAHARCWQGARRARSAGTRSPFSIRSALRSRTSRRCATCCASTRPSAARSTQIDLVPDLEDPKDLFALLAPQPLPRGARRRGGGMSAADARRPHRRADRCRRGRPRRLHGARSAAGRGLAAACAARELEVLDVGNLSGPANPWQPPQRGLSPPAGGGALEPAGSRAASTRAAARSAAGSARRRSLPEHRLDQRRGAPLPRAGPQAARAVAGCARRLQHQRCSPRAATSTACRSRACAASGRRELTGIGGAHAGHRTLLGAADRHPQRR